MVYYMIRLNERKENSMAYPLLTNCPVCRKALKITKLHCNHCQTTVENEFEVSRLAGSRSGTAAFY